jgi:hypothetical protein
MPADREEEDALEEPAAAMAGMAASASATSTEARAVRRRVVDPLVSCAIASVLHECG